MCLDLAALLMLNEQQLYLLGKIQSSQTGGQTDSDTSPYGECSLQDTYLAQLNNVLLLPFGDTAILMVLRSWV